MYPCNEQNKLPTISFVGGATKNLYFSFLDAGGSDVDVSSYTVTFSIVSAVHRFGKPIKTKPMQISGDNSVMSVSLSPSDTVDLFGKYIYQISIIDAAGDAEEPRQGEMYIYQNIDKSAITN